MRTHEQIQVIKSRIENPYSKEKFLTFEEINHLIGIFLNSSPELLIKKNTGPITLDLKHFSEDNVVSSIIKNLEKELGEFNITSAFFFKTNYPHIIHNDDTYELPTEVYKGITLPLKAYGNFSEYPKLCFFDQLYFHGPAKFFNGSKDIPTYYNQQIYEYSRLEGLINNSEINYRDYFTHLNPFWLKGLSINSILDWIPGNALIFDSVRLHCASDFRNLGITQKLGISIFTKKVS
jgi:hypothetical protein